MNNDALAKVEPACPRACSSCPWRLANQGSKPDPHKFYTPGNLARLWKGLRNGARMSCHPTDPRMAEFAGYEALSERDSTNECTGALILVQREMMLFQQFCEKHPEPKGAGLKRYRAERPNGMRRDGLVSLVHRAMVGGTFLDPIKMARPELNDDEVGYAAILRPPRIK